MSNTGISGVTLRDNNNITVATIGYGNASSTITPGTLHFRTTSSLPIAIQTNSQDRINITGDGKILLRNIPTSTTTTSVLVTDLDSVKKIDISSLPFVPEGTITYYADPQGEYIADYNSISIVTLTEDASLYLPANPPPKSRAIIKVFGSDNKLTVIAGSGVIDEQPTVELMPMDSLVLLHIEDNLWIILGN